MIEEIPNYCLYDIEHPCNVLTRLSIEFNGEEHLSLIYEKLLPQYCQSCPHLKKLEKNKED